ncbi:MAG: hypothetical protein WCI97_04170 [Bacteroidota bacterium]
MSGSKFIVGTPNFKLLSPRGSPTSNLKVTQVSSSGGGAAGSILDSLNPSPCGGAASNFRIVSMFPSGRPYGLPNWVDSEDAPAPAPAPARALAPADDVEEDVAENGSIIAPIEDLTNQEILGAFDSTQLKYVGSLQQLVAMILSFWAMFQTLNGKVDGNVLKKLLALIIDEHKPPIPSECTRRVQMNLDRPGTSVPRRYGIFIDLLTRTGIMGFQLKDPVDLMVGLSFGTLNSHLVSSLMQALQDSDLSNESVKTTFTFVLLFLTALMRNTILVKSPIELHHFVMFLMQNFNNDSQTGINHSALPDEDFSKEFKAAVKIVFDKVFANFKKLKPGKPLSTEQLASFKDKMAQLAIPDDDQKTSLSQTMSDDQIPLVLQESHARQFYALQTLVRSILLGEGDQLFEFNGDFSDLGPFFLFLSLLTSTSRKSSTIFRKEFEKVMAALRKASDAGRNSQFFGKPFANTASKFFGLIRLVFLEDSDAFIAKFFMISEGNKCLRSPTSLSECCAALCDKMNEIAGFSKPAQISMREQITELFPRAKFDADISDTEDTVEESSQRPSAAGGGYEAKTSSFRPCRQDHQQKSALKPTASSASASAFTSAALSAHTSGQSALAKILHTEGLTTPERSMILASKFMEAGISNLRNDLHGFSNDDVIETLGSVSVKLNPVQLKKLMAYVSKA